MTDEPTDHMHRSGHQVILIYRPDGALDYDLTMLFGINWTVQPHSAGSPQWQSKQMREHFATIRSTVADAIQAMLPSRKPLWVRIEVYLVPQTELELRPGLKLESLQARYALRRAADQFPITLFVIPTEMSSDFAVTGTGQPRASVSMFPQRKAGETGYGLYIQLVVVSGYFTAGGQEDTNSDEELILDLFTSYLQPEASSQPDITDADKENVSNLARLAAANYTSLNPGTAITISRIFMLKLPANLYSSLLIIDRSDLLEQFQDFTTVINFQEE